MRPSDLAKALAAGFVLLALNTALSAVAVFGYAEIWSQPLGQAMDAGAWITPVAAGLLMFAASWMLARRRPARNGLLFAGAVWLAYGLSNLLIDLGSGPNDRPLMPISFPHMALALAGGLAGSALARRGLADK
jgi:hypothetical protein